MNVDHLRLFVRVASTHNISSAGQELNLSPAVASSHIGKLESTLGVRLIHRTTRKVSLTEEGEAFLPHAEEVLASVDAAKASVGVGSSSPTGTLRVTAPASFGRMHLIPALKEFMIRYPDLSVDCRFSDSIVDMVEGGFDIAIRVAALKDSRMIARKLAPDNRIICASPDYIEKFGSPTTPHEINQHQVINLAGIDTWSFEDNNEVVTIKTKSKLKADNGETVRDACVNGMGLTISSTWCCFEHIKRGELVPILEDYPVHSDSAIWAVYPSSRLLAPKVRVFIDYFADYFGTPPYWE